MSAEPATTLVLDEDGPAAPPRSNGELVFAAPWEATAFGMAVALIEAGAFSHDDFRAALADSIAAWEALPEAARGPWSYYERWLDALQGLVFARDLIGELDLVDRIAALHHHDDHDHPHEHP